MRVLFSSLVLNREGAQEVQKSQYDQLKKDVEKFVADEDAGKTFDYWFKRCGPIIRDSSIPEDKRRDLILLKLDDAADDILPSQPHEIDFNTTVRNLQRMDEDVALKEMDYTSMKTLQSVAGLQDPSLREIRLRMLRLLDTQPEDAPLTIEDLVAECGNITALKVDNADMEASHDVHAVQKKRVKCFKCGGPHYKTFLVLFSRNSLRRNRKGCTTGTRGLNAKMLPLSPLNTLGHISAVMSEDTNYGSNSTLEQI
nr:unnamed protein product [Haemonchus contortus]